MEAKLQQAHISNEPSKLPYKLIRQITNDFDEKRILGCGGFATVYKGVYEDGRQIAVKVLHNNSGVDDHEFHNEFDNLWGLKHPNIVELVGFCHEWEKERAESEGKHVIAARLCMALCFEYVQKGSLHKFISDENTGFTWRTRYKIIKGICVGLQYLHGREPPIMHFDLKPDNILLDESMMPKIVDFGLSMLFGQEYTKKTTSAARTCGYWPPEYAKHQIISREFDIFSLGVIIVKIMAGHESYNSIVEIPRRKSVNLVQERWRKSLSGTMSHATLEGYCNQVKRCIELALDCLISNRRERPTIEYIVLSLDETEAMIGDQGMQNDKIRYTVEGMDTLVEMLLNPKLEARELKLSLLVNITDNFSAKHELGHGTYATVYKGLLPNGMMVAVKRLNVMGLVPDEKLFKHELDIMKKLKHDNVVRLLGYCKGTTEIHEKFTDGNTYPKVLQERLFCMEFAPHGHIKKAGSDKGDPWEDRYKIIKGVCNGLVYIHSQGYIHLDLKPANILMGEGMVPKLADFGVSKMFLDTATRFNTNISGTDGYRAPECIDSSALSKKADIYSLGAVIFDVMTGFNGPEYHRKTQEDKDDYLLQALHAWKRRLASTLHGHELDLANQQVEICLKIALICKDEDRHRRRPAEQISHILDLALDPYILDPQNIEAAVSVIQISSVGDMDLHPTEPWILLSRSSGHIQIIDYNNKGSLGELKLSIGPVAVHSAKFMERDDSWNIVAIDNRGFLYLCIFKVYERVFSKFRTIKATEGIALTSLAIDPSKRYVLLSTDPQKNGLLSSCSVIYIYDAENWTCIRTYHGSSYFRRVTHASFNTNEHTAFGIGCSGGKVKLWSHTRVTTTPRPYLVLSDHSEQVCSIDYFTCNSSTFILTGSMDKTAKVWKYDHKPSMDYGLASVTEPEATLVHEAGVTATCYIPESKVILTGTNDGVVSVWCAQTYRRKRFLCTGLGRICNLKCLLGRRVFIGHEHGVVLVAVDPNQL